MQLKLKKRELNITLYDGTPLAMGYPSKQQHDEYIKELISQPENQDAITKKLYADLGMSEDIFNELQQPDLFEIGLILTGQKKI